MANSIIQAQAMINGKNTYFVTRPRDVKFSDGSSLEEKSFGSGTAEIENDEITTLIREYLNGIKFEEEFISNGNSDEVPDDYLDPELISYIDSLFASLNDLVVDVPEQGWENVDNGKYTMTISVLELTGNEYPIVSVIPDSNTNSNATTNEISASIIDIQIESGYITIVTDKKFNTGFKLILKGINVQGGKIIKDYNSLAEEIAEINDKISFNDVIVDVTTSGWVNNNDVYTKTIPITGINSNQNLVFSLYNSPVTEAQEIAYKDIISLTTLDNAITLVSLSIPTENFKLLLKSALLTSGTIINENVQKDITITDNYETYDGMAKDRVAASSYAVFMVYKLLKQYNENVRDIENTIFDNHEGNIHIITKSGWCRVCGEITLTESTPVPLTILKNLPSPYSKEVKTHIFNGSTNVFELNINSNGIMTGRYGEINGTYYIDISYPYIEEE